MNQPGNDQQANHQRGNRWRVPLAALGVIVLFAALVFLGYRWMQSDALATLVSFTGNPERDQADAKTQWRKARSGDDFRDGDGARTAPDASADFRLASGAKLRLQPASQLRFQKQGPKSSLNVAVELGAVDVQTSAAAVTLESEFGPIALDANSRVTLSRTGGRLSVEVELGRLTLSGQSLGAGQQLQLELGGIVMDAPKPPEPPPAPPAVSLEPTPKVPELVLGDGVPGADLVVQAGDSFVVHDPLPPTAVGFRVPEVCQGPARLISGKQVTEAVGQFNLRFGRGQQPYEVRCLSNPDVVVASGRVSILGDSGNRVLPTFTPEAKIALDGRRYTLLYQVRLPKVTVTWPAAPAAASFTLKVGARTISVGAPTYTFQTLSAGQHQLVFSADTTPVRQSRATTIEVQYDNQAPTAQLSEPSVGLVDGSRTIRGSALPGWSVSVAGNPIEVDAQRNFTTQVRGSETVPLTFTHPNHGTHYYLRRAAGAP